MNKSSSDHGHRHHASTAARLPGQPVDHGIATWLPWGFTWRISMWISLISEVNFNVLMFGYLWICFDEFHWNPGVICVWIPLSLVEVMFLGSSWGICWNYYILWFHSLKGLLQIDSPYPSWVLFSRAYLTILDLGFLKSVVARPPQCGGAVASPSWPTCCRECNFEWQIWYCQEICSKSRKNPNESK